MHFSTSRPALRRQGLVAGLAAVALAATACGSSTASSGGGTTSTSSTTSSSTSSSSAATSDATSSSAMTSSAMTSSATSDATTSGSMTSGSPSSSPSATSGGGSGDAKTATSAAAFGGMDGLVAAANKEGALNLIALPPDWSDYKDVIAGFQKKYPGIKVTSDQPDISSAQEIQAADTNKGTDKAPDVFDLGASVTLENLDHFAPYQVAAWKDIPDANKESTGLWVNDYSGVMTVGYNADVTGKDLTSLDDLKDDKLKGAVALDGDPTAANEALLAVVFAGLANGGSLDDASKGLDYFKSLKAAGTLSTTKASAQLVAGGKINAIIGWSFNQLPITAAGGQNGYTWKTFTPKGINLTSYYNQTVNKDAPHPAAARLWEEYLYTAEAQNYWVKGGALPILYNAMKTAGTLNADDAKNIPVITGDLQQLNADQAKKVDAQVKAGWAKAIS